MRWVQHLHELHDFIGLVVLSAPDRFRKEDFLKDEDQLTLERAFEEIRNGLEFVAASGNDPTYHDRLRAVLEESLAAYRAGERKEGAHRLQDFRDMVFGACDRSN